MVEEVTLDLIKAKMAHSIGHACGTSALDQRPVEAVMDMLESMGLCIMPKEATPIGWFPCDQNGADFYNWAVSAFQKQLTGE